MENNYKNKKINNFFKSIDNFLITTETNITSNKNNLDDKSNIINSTTTNTSDIYSTIKTSEPTNINISTEKSENIKSNVEISIKSDSVYKEISDNSSDIESKELTNSVDGSSNKSSKLSESSESSESNSDESSDNMISSDLESENYKDTEVFEDIMLNKFFNNQIYTKYDVDIKKNRDVINILDKNILLNNYEKVSQSLENGENIYKKINDENPKLCSNDKCNTKTECKKDCLKNSMYKSIRNTNRGIKTIYHLLFKLVIYNPKYRNFCKCCEDSQYMEYLSQLDKNFNDKKENIAEDIKTRLEPKKVTELQINYLINKFMGVLGMLPCECRYRNKYDKFYKDNYLNFKDTIKIYTKTIPHVIKLLKYYHDIKDNHEELVLIKDSRCIHEDIRFNNITYCKKKSYKENVNKLVQEIIMKIDILNDWILQSIKIGIHLYNQQSLEYFIYVLKRKKYVGLIENFNLIYSLNNDLLDLNYESNKKNLFNCILDVNTSIPSTTLINLIESIKNQYVYRNKKYFEKYNINDIFVNYIIESFKKSNINIGLEFLKYINNLVFKKDYSVKLEYIFNTILFDENLSIKTKVSNLKIINKNKINVIEYDIVNKLIENNYGDKIILEFNKDENSLFGLMDYKNKEYIINIIKKCISYNKINILDYVLYNLNNQIKKMNIQPIILFLTGIPKESKTEYKYIGLLEKMLKYGYDINLRLSLFDETNDTIDLLNYCLINNFSLSAKLLIESDIKIDDGILFKCVDNTNHIIINYILKKNPLILNITINGLTVITYLFEVSKKNKFSSDLVMRFLIKLTEPIVKNLISDKILNFQDEKNELVGFKILNSSLGPNNKKILFGILRDKINPLEINKIEKNNINLYNFPLILYAVLTNEYEITYILLNYLFKNGVIKKNVINGTGSIFDYTHNSNKININFIPVILKFLQDNYKEEINIDKEYNKEIYLESDILSIKLFVLISSMIIINLIYGYENKRKSNIILNKINKQILEKSNQDNSLILSESSEFTSSNLIKNKISNKEYLNNKFENLNSNGYIEITVDSSANNILNTDLSDDYSSNKNIWLNSNTNELGNKIKRNIITKSLAPINRIKDNEYMKKLTKLGNGISKINNDNDSSISESDICFEKD